jgi:mannose-6-phosphate isomerase-like protein (cupin superfamily)
MASVKEQTVAPQGTPQATPKAEILDLKIQLVSKGHHKHVLAQTDMSSFNVHCYAPKGGENGMHAHMEEDHVFLVLQGEAQFVTPDGPMPVIGKHQALFIPKGAFYSFSAEGTENLVLARFGANPPGKAHGRRLDPNGNFIPGRAQKEGAVKPHFIEGKFFE